MNELGTGKPLRSNVAHVFKNTTSLCKGWGFMGQCVELQPTDKFDGPDDCVKCHKQLMKLRRGVKQ